MSVDAIPRTSELVRRHSGLVRVCHWINALAFGFLLMSGLQIFNANPQLNFGQATDFNHPGFALRAVDSGGSIVKGETEVLGHAFDTTGVLGASRGEDGELEPQGFPGWATLPSIQDLATGRRWHIFFAWILVLNGVVYLVDWIWRRRWSEFTPNRADWRALPHTIIEHIRLRFPQGMEALHYNVLQKLAYASVLIAFPILIAAGLTMSPAMDAAFPWLLDLFGGRQSARSIHFILATYLVVFLVVHLVMVVLSGPFNNLRGMITGRYRITEDAR